MNSKMSNEDAKILTRFINGHSDDDDLLVTAVDKEDNDDPTMMFQGNPARLLIMASKLVGSLKTICLNDPSPDASKVSALVFKIADFYANPDDEEMAAEALSAAQKLAEIGGEHDV